MGHGLERISDPAELTSVRVEARRVLLRSLLATVFATVALLLLP